ncbi:MAG: peptidoglycan-binding protein [Eubacteriales bacterium]
MNRYMKKIKLKYKNILKNIARRLKQRELKRQNKANIKSKRRVTKKTNFILKTTISKTKNAFSLFAAKIKNIIKLLAIKLKLKGRSVQEEGSEQSLLRSKKFKYNFNSWIRSKRGLISIGVAVLIIVTPIVMVYAFGNKNGEDQAATSSTDDTQDTASNEITLNDMFYGVDTLSVISTAVEIDREDIKPGITSPYVAELQEKLMELGYMEPDEPTEYYGPVTKQSVILFQREHDLTMDGCAGEKTWEILLSGNAKPYTVSIGDQGTDVSELQSRLRELGYMDTVNGNFGTETETAVKNFQEKNGLSADGKIGEQTREALYSENAKAYSISYGEESELVKTYQQRLKTLGYLTTTPDGKFGEDTVEAVKNFQSDNGLIADGYIGPTTKELLMSDNAEANVLKLGDRGDTVTKVQKKLNSLSYLSSKNVTGYYGSITESAVKAFQKRNSLSADGKVGAKTMTALFSGSAKKASSGSSSSAASADTSKVNQLISIAKSKLNCRYVWGAKGPSTFDCSGYVYWCLNQIGLRQGYLTSYGWRSVSKYPKITSFSSIKAGDIIVFNGHVGLAIGGGKMINASSSKGKVVISSLGQTYWKTHFICAYRVL